MERLGEGIVRSDAYLRTLFENGDKPTEDDFADLIESKAHKKEVFLKKDEVTNEDIDMLIESLFNSSTDDSNTFVVVDTNTNKNIKNNSTDSNNTTKSKTPENKISGIKGVPNIDKTIENIKATKKKAIMSNNNFKNPKNIGFKNHNNNFGKPNATKIRARVKK